jgi:hypothetical protein
MSSIDQPVEIAGWSIAADAIESIGPVECSQVLEGGWFRYSFRVVTRQGGLHTWFLEREGVESPAPEHLKMAEEGRAELHRRVFPEQAPAAPEEQPECSEWLRMSGKAYPRTCRICGLGDCPFRKYSAAPASRRFA